MKLEFTRKIINNHLLIKFCINNATDSNNIFNLDTKAMFYSTKKAAEKIADLIDIQKQNEICISLSNIDNKYKLLILQLIAKQLYVFHKYRTDRTSRTGRTGGEDLCIYISDYESNKKLINHIIHQINITNINRDFQNEPANIINPETFCTYAMKLLGKHKHLKINVLNNQDLQNQGFNLIYEMGKASVNKPKFMNIYYVQNPSYKTICLIGKGVCFDLGGVDIKKGTEDLVSMKGDKTGGCTVIALIKYIIESKMKINIIGLIPLINNVISGNSVLPGDILKSYSGKTVEITNTDAEGRIIMADAFGFSETLKNIDYIIDLATLTGSAEEYHCDTSAAIYTTNAVLQDIIEKLGEEVGDRIYSLPKWPEYVADIKSNVANVKNSYFKNCKKSGAFMASMFLSYFVPEKLRDKWVHFDITHNYDKYSNANTTILLINLLIRLA
jgi:leucyl aminopeptidase